MSMTTYASVTDVTQWFADELDGNSWSVKFTASRYYLPLTALKDISVAKVCVYPSEITTTPRSHSEMVDEVDIIIKVYARVTLGTLATQDSYLKLVEEIRDHFLHPDTTPPSGIAWEGSNMLLTIDTDLMNEDNLFSATLTFPMTCVRTVT